MNCTYSLGIMERVGFRITTREGIGVVARIRVTVYVTLRIRYRVWVRM